METLIDVDEAIKNVKKEKEMTEADLQAFIKTCKCLVNEGKLEESVFDIFETYTKAIRDLNNELNVLFKYKGWATCRDEQKRLKNK